MLKKIVLLLSVVLLSQSLNAAGIMGNSGIRDAAKDLDCEFEECKPEPPKVIIQEKIVIKEKLVPIYIIKEKIIIKEVAITNKNITQCNARVQAGRSTIDARQVELSRKSGSFVFSYETYNEKDRITIINENEVIFDSGCVGTNGTKQVRIRYSGSQSFVTVQVIPNCVNANSTSTQWKYQVHCPD